MIGDHEIGVPAVDLGTRELRARRRGSRHRDGNARRCRRSSRATAQPTRVPASISTPGADGHDLADDLVTGDDRMADAWQVAVDDVQVRPADGAAP
jgi:hypothetical protein